MGASTTGGNKLRAHFRHMRANMAEAKSVEIGFFPEDIHPKNHIPVAAVAFANEYGVPEQNIPARPFMRSAIAINQPQWNVAFNSALKAVQYHAMPAMEGMGALIQMQIRNSIETWTSPMNAPFTIAMKGFNDPLMETGYMLDHVKYKVQT